MAELKRLAWLLPSALAFAFILVARLLRSHPQVRKRITTNPLWKAQFVCHPLILLTLIYFGHESLMSAISLVPFLFNFAVEPWSLPNDKIFFSFFYLHHIAPLVLMHLVDIGNSTSQALLFAHAWTLHTIGCLDHWKMIGKQYIFWPYMVQGFIIKIFWWWSLGTSIFSTNKLPMYLQFIGRWGLYLRLKFLLGDKLDFDAFEDRKQLVELAAFALSNIVAVVVTRSTS